MDCKGIEERFIRYAIGYILQDSRVNPRYFPLFFKDFVILPDGTEDVPNKDHYELKDDSGLVIWRWKNDKPLVSYIDVL